MAKLYNQGMTLKARNNFTLVFSTIFLALCASALAFYLYKLHLIRSGESLFSYELSFKGLSPFSNNAVTLFFAAFCMTLYIPAASFYLYGRFEKTPSNEVAYFVLFLMGCVPELFKLFIPLETSPNAYPALLVFAGRALFWGRTLSFLSLFAASLLASSNMNLRAEQNIFVMLMFSLALASAVPVSTTKISAAFNIPTGWPVFLNLLYALAAVLTAISYAIKGRENEEPLCYKLAFDVLSVEAGLLLLNASGILAASAIGAALLFTGTFRYFDNLHKLYR